MNLDQKRKKVWTKKGDTYESVYALHEGQLLMLLKEEYFQ